MNMTSLSRWGSSNLPVIKPSMSRGPKIWSVKEGNRKIRKLNLMLPSLELKTISMMNLLAQGRTKEKGTMGNKKSGVFTAGRVFTLNMPTWRKILMKKPLSLEESHQSSGELSEERSLRSGTTAWERSCPYGKHFEVQITADWKWSFKSHDGWKRLLFILGDQQIHSHPLGRWLHHHYQRTRYCKSRKWFFSNVLYVPSLAANLLSVC